jgi:hypothetical protein
MAWAGIIAALIELFGPLLTDWLKSCTEERLEDAAADLPATTSYANEGEAVGALFDAAIADLPRLAFVRRAALRRMKAASIDGKKMRRAPLTAEEVREARDLVGGVRNE